MWTRWRSMPSGEPGNAVATVEAPAPAADERLGRSRVLDRLVVRPEISALLGAVLVFLFFSLVTKSFVTLGTFLALQGINLGVTKAVTHSVLVNGMRGTDGYESAGSLFASTITIGGTPFHVSIIWWIGLTAVAAWLLVRTKFGNWIFAV